MATPRVLRRFQYNLTVGTDICHVVRIRSILASSRGRRFVQKILTDEERGHPKIQRFLTHQHESPTSPKVTSPKINPLSHYDQAFTSQELQAAASFLAGRFAAKEAVIKAHPHRSLTWHEIVITRQPSTHPERAGAPMAIVRGADEDYEALLSISHDGEYATAVCLGNPDT